MELEVDSVEEAVKKITELGIENKPTKEEIDQAEKNFNEAGEAFNNKMYEIGGVADFHEVTDFLLTYIENNMMWSKAGWMGAIKLHDEVSAIKKTAPENSCFTLGYQAMEFTYYALSSPGGIGLNSAKEMEKIAEQFDKVFDLIAKQLEIARAELKEIQWLQDVYTAACQGFRLEKEDGVVKEDIAKEETIEEKFEEPSV